MRKLLKQFPRAEALARRLIALYPLSARLGPSFWEWYAFLEESQSWAPDRLRAYQFRQLRSLLARLALTSPYYAKRLSGVPVDQIDDLEGLKRWIPPMTRQEFSENYAEVKSRELQGRDCMPAGTSGTTGSSLQFFHPLINWQREWASICHQWGRVGYDPARSRRAEFRGLTSRDQLYQEFPEQNMVRFSILALRKQSLPAMANVISTRSLRFFHGYPSALYLLAKEIVDHGMRFPEPEAVLLASEMVYDFQLQQIQRAFPNARIFAHYGCAEFTVLGAWCEHRRVYHLLPQYSIVEVDRGTGEIIGTNLYNDVNGFVRYRMTDTAGGVEDTPCPACKRPYTPIITGLDGRREDYLYSRERGWIAPAIVTYPLKQLREIQEVQFSQEDPDLIEVRYVLRSMATAESAEKDLSDVMKGLRRLMGDSIKIRTVKRDSIPRGPTGKFKWIVSRLNPSADRIGGSHN